MANSARIDDLQKKFDENPRRYFAPLANEYRKAGDPEQAIAICREFLPQQPGHMSGHFVYGKALYDAHQLDEAKSVFDTALTLDPENLIALRYLGDIARALGDPGSARTWYQRVLDADPRNDEIAALMTELANAPPAPPAEAPLTGPTGTVVMPALSLQDLTGSAPPGIDAPAAAPPEPEPQPAAAAEPAAAPIADSVSPEPPSAPVVAASLATEPAPAIATEAPAPEATRPVETPAAQVAAAVPEAPPEASAPPAEELLDLDELDITASEPAALEADRPRPSLDTAGFDVERAGDGLLMPGIGAAAETRSLEESESEPEPAVASDEFPLDDFEVAAAPAPTESTPSMDPFATETMADLYRSQGHLDAALRVYRQLLAQRPDDADIQAHIAELEAAVAEAPAATPPAQEVPDLDASSFTFDPNAEAVGAGPGVEATGLVIEPPAGLINSDVNAASRMETTPAEGFAPTAQAEGARPPASEASAETAKTEPPVEAVSTRAAGPSIREFLAALGSHVLGWTHGDSAAEVAEDQHTQAAGAEPDALEVQAFAAEATVGTVEVAPVAPPSPADSGLGSLEIADEAPPASAAAEPEAEEGAATQGGDEAASRGQRPSGGGSIDLMFDSGEVTAEDQAAAEGLAGAYGLSAEAGQALPEPIEGAPARRATEELSLDSVFRDQRSSAPPAQGGKFSFDKFFANPTPAMGSSIMETPPLGQPSESADDDIQQFNSWLDGLKKR